MPYNIAYETLHPPFFQGRLLMSCSMISDFFYPQPGGVESHIYQLSTVRVCPLPHVPAHLHDDYNYLSTILLHPKWGRNNLCSF